MLSICRMSLGQEGYYDKLAREDYYLEGGEPPGRWCGEAAETLGLSGQVASRDLTEVFSGKFRGRQLVQTGGQHARCPGWDLTFSAPKSVSTLWSQADPEMARRVQECQQRAVEKALAYVESRCGITRRGKGGQQLEKAKCLFATFEHGTSRAQQPQLHTHALMLNVGLREDGTTGALHSTFLYQHKMAAGAIYRAELSHLLGIELGLDTMRVGNVFEVVGVDPDLCDEFSARRKQIEAALEETGASGAVASAKLALTTRTNKQDLPRAELQKIWREVGMQHGFSTEQVNALAGRALKSGQDAALLAKLSIQQATEELIESNSTFTEKELVRFTAQAAQGRPIGADLVLETAVEHLKTSQDIIRLGTISHEAHYTTRAHYEMEQAMIEKARGMLSSPRLEIPEEIVSGAIENSDNSLTPQQEAAVRHILQGEGQIAAVIGDAGTGKTTILKPVREALETAGYEVRGAALAGRVAEDLTNGAGIDSQTIRSLVWSLDHIEQGWNEAEARAGFNEWAQRQREERGDISFSPQFSPERSKAAFEEFTEKWSLTEKTVLIIDEAAMVDTRSISKLIDHAERSGAKIAFVGDPKQLQAIQAGGAFTKFAEMANGVRLTEIFRQREEERPAVERMAEGEVRAALAVHAERGSLVVAEDRKSAQLDLIEDWAAHGVDLPEHSLMLAATNLDVVNLNREAQQRRMEAGKLGEKSLEVGNYELRKGDRVLFAKRDKRLGVENGSRGTVRSISPLLKTVTVDLDGEGGSPSSRRRTISTNSYSELRLGYASTTHKAQGATVERAFVLTDEAMIDHQISYVQMSRARESTRIYTTSDQAGDDLRDLVRQMERDRKKQLALQKEALAKQSQASLRLTY